jgi:hypothetical protein
MLPPSILKRQYCGLDRRQKVLKRGKAKKGRTQAAKRRLDAEVVELMEEVGVLKTVPLGPDSQPPAKKRRISAQQRAILEANKENAKSLV